MGGEYAFIIIVALFLTLSWWGPLFERKKVYIPRKSEYEEKIEQMISQVNRRREPISEPVKKVPVVEKKRREPVKKTNPPAALPTTGEVVNIAPNPTDISWFLCTHKDLPAPSTAESLIIECLSQYSVEWYREVSFKGLQFTPYSWPRYDFYLPGLRLVLEYDGQSAHSNDTQIATDKAKDKFCHDNKITIIRLNRLHYYKMGPTIDNILKTYKVRKK